MKKHHSDDNILCDPASCLSTPRGRQCSWHCMIAILASTSLAIFSSLHAPCSITRMCSMKVATVAIAITDTDALRS
eukprot:5427507-Amphidinium_carterae.1